MVLIEVEYDIKRYPLGPWLLKADGIRVGYTGVTFWDAFFHLVEMYDIDLDEESAPKHWSD